MEDDDYITINPTKCEGSQLNDDPIRLVFTERCSEPCLNRISPGPAFVFRIDRCSVCTG